MNGFLGEFLGTMILIVLGVGCPEGWCIVALDPVSGHRETIGSFEEGPFEVQRESRNSPTLRSRHDPAACRSGAEAASPP